jgi:hypothetical protein
VKLKILVLGNFKFLLRYIGVDTVEASVHKYYSENSKPMLGGWYYLAHGLVLGEENSEAILELRQILLLHFRVPPHFFHHVCHFHMML